MTKVQATKVRPVRAPCSQCLVETKAPSPNNSYNKLDPITDPYVEARNHLLLGVRNAVIIELIVCGLIVLIIKILNF